MWYLFGQVWLLLIISFALGWFSHRVFCYRNKQEKTAQSTQSIDSETST